MIAKKGKPNRSKKENQTIFYVVKNPRFKTNIKSWRKITMNCTKDSEREISTMILWFWHPISSTEILRDESLCRQINQDFNPSMTFACSGVATGWTGVDMSTPVFPEFDFLISRNPLKKLWGGGVDFHSLRTFISFSQNIHFINSFPDLFEVFRIIATC